MRDVDFVLEACKRVRSTPPWSSCQKEHRMQARWLKKPVPAFKASAVVDGFSKRSSSPTTLASAAHASPATSTAASTNSQHSRFAWATSPRTQGSLGPDLKLPFIADRNISISRVVRGAARRPHRGWGHCPPAASTGRGFFIVDPKGIPRPLTINDLPSATRLLFSQSGVISESKDVTGRRRCLLARYIRTGSLGKTAYTVGKGPRVWTTLSGAWTTGARGTGRSVRGARGEWTTGRKATGGERGWNGPMAVGSFPCTVPNT
ncbi:uncharacterized protein BXZ73DRAFT_86027 [Epithele typhae]|uniref:uncharacterized protein n=1 Tax=Epithele typhae TaxID=378194 RepID=UPI0020072173|nr:uncharacterized protein BXZ73DRAFT_86027 [Epithele typhae]KAH9889757.1 hypothetical protein BXZ73DRAFT_86027 [Epithele typhae]